MSIREQARAEAEKRWNAAYGQAAWAQHVARVGAFVQGAEWAATRTRVVTTVTELDALPVGSVVLDKGEDPWQKSDVGWHSPNPYLPHAWSSERLADLAPLTVLYDPEETR